MTLAAQLPEAATTTEQDAPARNRTRFDTTLVTSGLTIVAIMLLWALAANRKLVSAVFLPWPLTVVKSLGTVATAGFVDSTLAQHTLASRGHHHRRAGRRCHRLDPIVEFLRPLPPLAYLPLVIIWLGIGEASKITVIALAMLPPVIISTASGVRSASKDHINAARSFGATRWQVLRHVILPGPVPSILTGTRVALGAGWSTLVAAELIAASRGLGFMIQSAAQFLVTDIVIAGIFVIAIIAFLFELVARVAERVPVPWASHR